MKTLVKIALFGLLTFSSTATLAQSAEHEAVQATLQDFQRAYVTGEARYIRESFHKDGQMIAHSRRGDRVVVVSGDEFAGRFDGQPAADEAQRKRIFQILDITGRAALVKVTLDYPTWDGVDYLALAKIDGRWLIISKSYGGQVKPVPPRDAAVPAASAGAR